MSERLLLCSYKVARSNLCRSAQGKTIRKRLCISDVLSTSIEKQTSSFFSRQQGSTRSRMLSLVKQDSLERKLAFSSRKCWTKEKREVFKSTKLL